MATTPTGTPTPEYVLGHDRAEIARLEQQAAALAPHSRVILEARVRDELAGDRTVFAPPALIGAWGTT